MTNNSWRSVDAQIQDWAGTMFFSRCPIKVANTLFMTVCNLLPYGLPKIHDQQLLMLHWCSFSRWGRESIEVCFAYKGGQKFIYKCLQPIGGVITPDARPNIVDAQLTLIVMYCIVNISFHQWFYKYRSARIGCLAVRLKLNLVA